MDLKSVFKSMNERPLKAPPNRRAELIGKLTDGINACIERDNAEARRLALNAGKKPKIWPKRTYKSIGIRLAHLTEADLEWFHGYCQESKHYAKCFWWHLSTANRD